MDLRQHKKYLAYLLEPNIAEVIVIGGIVLLFGPEFMLSFLIIRPEGGPLSV